GPSVPPCPARRPIGPIYCVFDGRDAAGTRAGPAGRTEDSGRAVTPYPEPLSVRRRRRAARQAVAPWGAAATRRGSTDAPQGRACRDGGSEAGAGLLRCARTQGPAGRRSRRMSDIVAIALGFLQGFLSSTVVVLALFIGFCVLLGFAKLKKTAGG